MSFVLHLTSVGRGHLADSTNAGIQNVQLRRLAVGSGSGAGDAADADARTALRTQEDVADVVGSAQPDSGRIGATATFAALATGSTDVEIREVGLFARVGDDGTEFLLAYGARPADEEALISLTASGRTVVAGVMDISSAAADVAITVDADITFSGLDAATNDETAAGVRNDRAVPPSGLAFALKSPLRKALADRRGTMFAAVTRAQALDDTDEDSGVTPKALNAVLGLITVLHFTASNPTYVWDTPFSRAFVILKAGDGGGGDVNHIGDGGAGGDTSLTVNGATHTAVGGRGGAGGNTAWRGASRSGEGGKGGGRPTAAEMDTFTDGGSGLVGEYVFQTIDGLSRDDILNIVVGAGGATGSQDEGEAGDPGWVRIIPLPGAP